MIYEIKHKITGRILFSLETSSMKLTVEAAVKANADLRSADLQYADLRSADLRSADLRSASLRSADLRYADLRSADLQYASLRSADLRYADLQYASLRSADLRYADLRSADLRDADLQYTDLRFFRDDLWAVLSSAPNEVMGLRTALAAGRIDGSTYEGTCACLVGTLAKVRGCRYDEIDTLTPDSERPAEVFFDTIRPGDTPDNHANAKLAMEWIDLWLTNMRAVFEVKS
jgi:hypothetical protein